MGRKDEDGFESKQMEPPSTEYKGACDGVVRPVVVDGVRCSAATDSSQAATCDRIVPQSVVKARKRWARVKSEMVDAKVMTRVMNELKEELQSDGGNLQKIARSHSDGSLSPCQTWAAAGLAAFFVKSVTTSLRQVIQTGPDRGHFGNAFSVTGLGPKNQYAKVQSKCIKRTLNPVYNQIFEMHLEGGEIDKNGKYHNQCAPFTQFRLEMWDRDLLSSDDFMGEITVPLTPLMSCRTMEGWFELTDPEGAYKNDDEKPLSGRVYLKFKWNYEALLEGSMRPKRKENDDKVNDNDGNDNDTDFIHVPHLSFASSHSPAKNRSTGKFVGCPSSHPINGEERGGGNASLIRWPMSLSDNTTSGGEPQNSSPVLGIGSLPGESKKGVSHFGSKASPIPMCTTSPIWDRFPLLLPDESGDKGFIPSLHFRSSLLFGPKTGKENDQSKVASNCNDEVDSRLDELHHKWHMKKSPLSCASSHMPAKNGRFHLKASQSETASARDNIINEAASDSRRSQAPIHPYEAGQSETTSARDNVCPKDAELAGLKRRLVSKETELQKARKMCSETEFELEALRKELVAKKEFDVLLSANKKEDQHTNAAANKENEGKDKDTAPSHKGKATEAYTAEDMRARSETLKVLHLLPPHPAPPLQASVEDKVVAGKKCSSDTLRSGVGVN